MTDEAPLRLAKAGFVLELAPAHGGAITRFAHDGVDLMRPAGPAWRDSRAAACFPLVPFSNRVADAVFRFGGREERLERNFTPEPHAIHGHGWQAAWQVDAVAGDAVAMSFVRDLPGELLRYRARQRVALRGDGLEVTLGLENLGDGDMPAGIGIHPYFPRRPGTTVTAALASVWLPDGRKIPHTRAAVPPAWDLAHGRAVEALELDHCFAGWDGRAVVAWPELGRRLVIQAEPVFGHLVVYVPAGRDFFCVEPVSHVNDGFNRLAAGEADTGVVVLAPGAALGGSVTFRLEHHGRHG